MNEALSLYDGRNSYDTIVNERLMFDEKLPVIFKSHRFPFSIRL